MTDDAYTLYGALGSPYSVKMRALMRYRRIAHRWVTGADVHAVSRDSVKTPVIPVLRYPDGSHANDSTFLIQDLERRHSGRSAIPARPGDAFLALLIEDFADEWLTKAMFSYRWLREVDQAQMSRWLAFDAMAGGGLDTIERFAASFRDRQVGRMAIVGCTQANAPLIEASTSHVLAALEGHVTNSHFLFGTRPSVAEFAVYGQLMQLATDPTPQALLRADYPYTYRWLAHVDDWSGIEGEWSSGERPPVIAALLDVIGAVYLPFLLANAAALARGDATFGFESMGCSYSQGSFKYQGKCLAVLRQAFASLPAAARADIAPLLDATRCLAPLEGTR